MAFNEARLERYAMKLEEMSQASNDAVTSGIDLFAVGDALGLTRNDARELAQHLRDSGWAVTDFATAPTRLRLTIEGYRQIAKMRQPRWQRWLDKHPKTQAAIMTIAILLVGEIVKHFFWPTAVKP
jgi:biotin operon repressor